MATWNINQLERETSDGFVIVAHFSVTEAEQVDDKNYVGYAYSTVSFPYEKDKPGFIPFEQLSKEQVIEWVKSSLGDEAVLAYESAVAQQISDQKSPKTQSGLPW